MNAYEFMNYEIEFDLNNPYMSIEEEMIGMLDQNESSYNVQIGDMVFNRVVFKHDKCALAIL